MTDNDREKIALFRFAIISPILNGQVQNQKEYLEEITAKTHNVPYYGPKEYVPKKPSSAGLGITIGVVLMPSSLKDALITAAAVRSILNLRKN